MPRSVRWTRDFRSDVTLNSRRYELRHHQIFIEGEVLDVTMRKIKAGRISKTRYYPSGIDSAKHALGVISALCQCILII